MYKIILDTMGGDNSPFAQVEGAVMAINEISRCCCIFHENKIFAFYSGAELAVKDIVAVLRKSLPVFMIPSEFVFVKEFVLNKNGKIDRNVLKEMIDAEKAD